MISENKNIFSLNKDSIVIENLTDETMSLNPTKSNLSLILFILNLTMVLIALIGKSMIIRFILKHTSYRLVNVMILKDQVIHHIRGRKILEQLSRTRFLRDLKFPLFFLCYVAAEKRVGISNPVKNIVFESCSNIFFTLV